MSATKTRSSSPSSFSVATKITLALVCAVIVVGASIVGVNA